MPLFDGKIVWITGAGSGIGKAGALMFAEEGAGVALIGRRREKLEETAAAIAAKKGKSFVVPLDIGDRERVQSAATRLLAELGRVDIPTVPKVYSPAETGLPS